jgi:hypothetical protein
LEGHAVSRRTGQITPGGVRVCGTKPAPPELLAAVDELARAVVRMEEARLAALPPAERAEEDARRAAGQARLRRLQRRAREDR